MIFGKNTLFSLLLGFFLLTNILELIHVNFLYTTTLISFCGSLLLPGFLIALILRIRKISFWENLLLIVGLSIAFLEFGGLLLNILLPLFGVKDPLTFQNIIIGFDIYIFLLFICAWIRTKQLVVRIQLPRRSKTEKLFYILPLFFPLLATLGAIVLNNGGSDILTLILLGMIALYTLFLVLLRNKVTGALYPYALFFMAVASLFTTSLRSWYISGHDVEREFYVFQLTNTHHLWNMAFYQDAYNACLSITILPTILTNLLTIQDMYVYKVTFQILFATSPLLVFFIVRNYTTPVLAFLSAFFFMSFPTFFNDMPMLNRQEIGFIFFGLALYMLLKGNQMLSKSEAHTLSAVPLDSNESETHTLSAVPVDLTRSETLLLPTITTYSLSAGPLDPTRSETSLFPTTSSELSLSMRKILFLIFALSVIVSHYSTNFVLLALVAFMYILSLIISLPFVEKIFASLLLKPHISLKNTFTNKVFLSLPLVLVLFGMTYAWNTLYTKSSNHTGSVISEVVSSIFVKSNGDTQSNDLSYSLFSPHKVDPKQQLQSYIQSIKQLEEAGNSQKANMSQFYSTSITNQYPIYPVVQEQLAPTSLGTLLTSFHIPVFTIQAALRSLSAAFMQIFVFIGLFAIIFLKSKKPFDLQYLLLCFGALFILALETVLPALSVEYGVLRMFQQFLFVLSLPIVLGLCSVLFFMKEQKRIIFTGIIAIIFFLNLTGFVSHLTGDYYPQMTLDNAGLYYDAYYVHKSDVLAIVWLSKNNVNNEPVETDLAGGNILLTYGNIDGLSEIFPPIMRKNAYVYLEVSNDVVVSVDSDIQLYNSSKPFLDENKDLVYSNGSNNVYK